MNMLNSALKLCYITEGIESLEDETFIINAIKGGVSSIQLRDKKSSLSRVLAKAKTLSKLLKSFSIPLIINDYIEIAQEINAEGVHLGQNDCSPFKARELLGANKIIGLSIESFEELEQANCMECIDYVAASAIFQSTTKLDCRTIWGIEGLKEIVKQSLHPVIGIGGINVSNIADVLKAGAKGVAVISAIQNEDNPFQQALDLSTKFK